MAISNTSGWGRHRTRGRCLLLLDERPLVPVDVVRVHGDAHLQQLVGNQGVGAVVERVLHEGLNEVCAGHTWHAGPNLGPRRVQDVPYLARQDVDVGIEVEELVEVRRPRVGGRDTRNAYLGTAGGHHEVVRGVYAHVYHAVAVEDGFHAGSLCDRGRGATDGPSAHDPRGGRLGGGWVLPLVEQP